jgi:hypothetical protein
MDRFEEGSRSEGLLGLDTGLLAGFKEDNLSDHFQVRRGLGRPEELRFFRDSFPTLNRAFVSNMKPFYYPI